MKQSLQFDFAGGAQLDRMVKAQMALKRLEASPHHFVRVSNGALGHFLTLYRAQALLAPVVGVCVRPVDTLTGISRWLVIPATNVLVASSVNYVDPHPATVEALKTAFLTAPDWVGVKTDWGPTNSTALSRAGALLLNLAA